MQALSPEAWAQRPVGLPTLSGQLSQITWSPQMHHGARSEPDLRFPLPSPALPPPSTRTQDPLVLGAPSGPSPQDPPMFQYLSGSWAGLSAPLAANQAVLVCSSFWAGGVGKCSAGGEIEGPRPMMT